ncbi:MAG: flagellar hook-basal body complex protein FliE [Spirochaetales bacterium]|nr:flagellar hook-basal body complex protein FliE [Spirochaetales bacterium]
MNGIFNPGQAHGHVVQLDRTNDTHLTGRLTKNQPSEEKDGGFAAAMSEALHGVNDLQQESLRLNQQMLLDPDSVDAHDVTIAMGKANMALQITKSVVDNALKAYREIINLR